MCTLRTRITSLQTAQEVRGPEQDGDVNGDETTKHEASRATSQRNSSQESNDSTRRLVTQLADHTQHVKAGDAASGPREEHVGQRGRVISSSKTEARRKQWLEKESSNKQRRVTYVVTNNRSANTRGETKISTARWTMRRK